MFFQLLAYPVVTVIPFIWKSDKIAIADVGRGIKEKCLKFSGQMRVDS